MNGQKQTKGEIVSSSPALSYFLLPVLSALSLLFDEFNRERRTWGRTMFDSVVARRLHGPLKFRS